MVLALRHGLTLVSDLLGSQASLKSVTLLPQSLDS